MTTGENDNTWGDQTNDNIKRLDDMVNQIHWGYFNGGNMKL